MPTEAGQPNNQTVKWYEPTDGPEDEITRAGNLISETAAIEQYQSAWHQLNLWNATLYSGRELVGFNWGVVRDTARELWPTNMHVENLIQEVGGAMLSKASSSPLKPTPVPRGNSWKVERACRLLDEFCLATWQQTESEEACVRAYLDAYISSIGCVQDYYDEKTKTLHCEPVFFDQIVIDNRECINRALPRTYRIRKVMPRAAIEARYPKADLLKQPYLKPYVTYRDVGDGWDVLVEAWRLPDHQGKGGRHTIACAGRLLVDEPYKETEPPLVFLHWRDRLSGFFSQSGVEELVPYQVRQNELNEAIRESQDIACRPRMKLHANSVIDLSQWDNVAGRFVMWSGSEPMPLVWPTNLQELYNERERNKTAAFSHVGQSEMFAHADLPEQVRLDSSAGVREFRNLEDSRHLRQWTMFEKFRLNVMKMHLRVLAQHKAAAAYTAVYHPARAHAAAKAIPYEAVKILNEDQYSWSLEATPLSQMSPAARRETLRDYVSRGLMDDAQARRMYTNPNIEREESLELASYDDVYRHIDLLEDDKYEAPDETTNLTYGIKQVIGNLHRLRCFDDVPKSILEKHKMWVMTAVAIQQSAIQQQQNQAVAFAPTQGMPGTNASLAPHTLVQQMAPQQ